MALNSMYFFITDGSNGKFLVIRIEGEKKKVAKSSVGVIIGERVPESLSGPFTVMRVEFTRSGTSYSSSMGEVKFRIENLWGSFQKNKDNLSYVLVVDDKMLSPRKISIPGDWL